VIIFVVVIVYIVLAVAILPKYYPYYQSQTYEQYLGYALTAVVTLIYTGTTIGGYLDSKNKAK
jgi:hypothetical protein